MDMALRNNAVEKTMKAAPALAAAAFALLLGAFYLSMRSYRGSLQSDACRDLETRTEMAAATLEEPLRTQDFAAVRRFGDSCRSRGYELSVRTGGGGRMFDTRSKEAEASRRWIGASIERGGYIVSLHRPKEDVYATFRRAYRLFVLAALAGAAGMLYLFVAFYRQRVRIRELAKLEAFQREFVADVSHEIKTPLTGILGAVQMLGDDPEDPAVRKRLLDMLSKESTRLNTLVQQILDLARLERDGQVLERVESDVSDVVKDVVESMRDRASANGIVLEFRSDGPRRARIDVRLVSEAVENLVSNAIRHSSSPDVVVSVSGGQGIVVVAVEDHGVGIAPEHSARVFERFHRVDEARAQATGGAGLGLAIVSRIARLHGGKAALAAAVPHGCVFSISLPI